MKYSNGLLKKLFVLFLVFCVAVALILFFGGKEEPKEQFYVPSGSSTLPVVYMEVEGEFLNASCGYTEKMQAQYIRGTLTPLAEDRRLTVQVEEHGGKVIDIRYEIRSLDTERLVEDAQLKSWDSADGNLTAVLPIPNMLEDGKEYILILDLSTESYSHIYYYTRIVKSDGFHTGEMMEFVRGFHEKTLSGEASDELVVYMKNTTADRATLANVSLHSTFSQLTWGQLSPVAVTSPRLDILDMNDSVGTLRLSYRIRDDGGNTGQAAEYDVEEVYNIQWSKSQWYVLSFQRTMDQVFRPGEAVLSSGVLDLGILEEDVAQAEKSKNGDWTAFCVNGELYSCQGESGGLVRVFSFSGMEGDGGDDSASLGDSLRDHEIQIVDVSDEGDVHFIVYGYMNNGLHEGEVGMAFYEYTHETNELNEIFYLPTDIPYQVFRENVGTLCYLSESGLFYLMFGGSVYGIDFKGNEFVAVVEQVSEESMAISRDSSRIAWQEGPDAEHGTVINVMDLDRGERYSIEAEEGEYMKALGFIENDLICGIARAGDVNGGDGGLADYPMYAVEIYGEDPEPTVRYEKPGIYISGVNVEPGSVTLYRMEETGDGNYREISEDALIRNSSRDDEESEVLLQASDERRGTVYQVQAGGVSGQEISLSASLPKGILSQGNVISIQGGQKKQEKDENYYAFSFGRLRKICGTAKEAIQLTYDDIGTVVYGDGNYVLRRGYRGSSRKLDIPQLTATGQDSLAACMEILLKMNDKSADVGGQLKDGKEPVEILRDALPGTAHDLSDCALEQIMYYYISLGCPLIAQTQEDGTWLIVGYDYQNVFLYSPLTGESETMGIDDASEYFSRNGNRFIGYVP